MENEFEWNEEIIPEEASEQEAVLEQPVYEAPNSEEFSYQYSQVNPIGEPQPVEPKKKKKSGCFKTVMAVVLVAVLAFGCSVFGGILGAFGMKVMLSKADKNENMSNNGTVDVLEGDRESTIVDIHKVDTDKQMTPAEVYAVNVASTVGITTSVTTNYWGYTTTSAAAGSGFVYSSDGYILTNFHVIEDSNSITVSFYDGTSMDAKLIGYDESNDIAVLKVDATNLKPVVLGNSNNLNVGDPVLAIGNPLGELTFSLTAGAVSALNREVTFSGGLTMNLIQTDCAINSGNSGGPLFNLYGEVIGITNAKYSGNSSSGASIDSIGFAIPMNQVRPLVDSIIEKGYVVKPYIGVSITDVSQESLGYGLPKGASIQAIEPNSPAQQAGLNISDIVTKINDEEISGASDLKKVVTASAPGDVLELTVWRKGEIITLTLTVGEQSQKPHMEEPQQPQETQSMMPGFPFFDWGY